MERSRDGDGHRAALGVAHKGVELLECCWRSGNHGLLRAVVVHGPCFARLLGEPLHRLCIELQDGAHCTGVCLGGSGHELSAVAYELEALGVGVGAGKGERSHLAEREASNGGRCHAMRFERVGAGEVGGEDTRLGVRRVVELLLGALEALGARAGTRGVRRLEDGAGGGLALGKLHAHAGVLCALAREQECYLTHAGASFRSFSAPFTRSSTISAALWRSCTMPAIWPHMNEPSS